MNKMLAYNLTADGYGVTSALNARTAAEAIRQREFNLVLCWTSTCRTGTVLKSSKRKNPRPPIPPAFSFPPTIRRATRYGASEVGAVDYITKALCDRGPCSGKIKAMFAMLEHHKPAKDIYDDGRLFLDFSEQTASLKWQAPDPIPDGVQNAEPVPPPPAKTPAGADPVGAFWKRLGEMEGMLVDALLTSSFRLLRSRFESDVGPPPTPITSWAINGREARQNEVSKPPR